MVFPPRPATAVRDAWRETLPGRSSSTGDFRIAHQHLGVRRVAQAGAMAMHSRGRRRSTGSGCVAECPGTGSPGGAGEPARAARNLNRPQQPSQFDRTRPCDATERTADHRSAPGSASSVHPSRSSCVFLPPGGGDTHLKKATKTIDKLISGWATAFDLVMGLSPNSPPDFGKHQVNHRRARSVLFVKAVGAGRWPSRGHLGSEGGRVASDATLHGAATDDAAVRAGLIRWTVSPRDESHHSRWLKSYLWAAGATDGICALAAGLLALEARFAGWPSRPREYLILTALMPLLWVLSLAVARGYDARFVGVGPDEFRNVLNVGATLTAAIAILSFVTKSDIARGYVLIALPCATAFDLVARYVLRKRLHKRRTTGACMRRVIAVGPAARVADLIGEMRREKYHGLSIVGACLTERSMLAEIAGIPVMGGILSVSDAIAQLDADAVAVAAYRDLTKMRLRELAWELEATGTDLFVAPALLDVAGPRTTIRPVASLPLLYVDHPEFSGIRWVIKGLFDRLAATAALVISAPLLGMIAFAIALRDG